MHLTAVSVLLALSFIAPGASSADVDFFDLGPQQLADDLRAREPSGLPKGGALDALADISSRYERDRSASRDIELEEPTTLNAIALSRRSADPLTVAELTNIRDEASRATSDSREFALDRENVLSALALGHARVTGPLRDLLSASHRYSTSDRTVRTVDLADEETMSGLALMANGIDLDARDLVTFDAVANGSSRTRQLSGLSPDPRLVQGVSLSGEVAAAAVPLFSAEGTVDGTDLTNATFRTSDRGSFSRDVALPEQLALLGVALHNNDIEVDGADLLTFQNSRVVGRIGSISQSLDRGTVFQALLLGASAR